MQKIRILNGQDSIQQTSTAGPPPRPDPGVMVAVAL